MIAPILKGKRKTADGQYCCFIWTQGLILKPLVFWPKFGSDEDWVSRLLIAHVNDKSPVIQEEIDYVLCWRQCSIVLFSLKVKEKEQKEEKTKTPFNWDFLSSLPPHNPTAPLAQVPEPVPTSVPQDSVPPTFPSWPFLPTPCRKFLPAETPKGDRAMLSGH
jgi:hypothetical protein